MKRYLLVFIFLLCSTISFAQAQDVKLTVSGQGKTEEEAVNNALRLAVEEAYGVFVSANSNILNDEVVKDEIATISSGNIKSFKLLSSFLLPNSDHSVTLETLVSPHSLVSYAKSHGSDCEFAGATFGANLRLFEQNKQNSKIAISNLLEKAKILSSQFYNYELNVSNPKANGEVTFSFSVHTTKVHSEFIKSFLSTLESISIDEDRAEEFISYGLKLKRYECTPYSFSSMSFVNGIYSMNFSPERGWRIDKYFYSEMGLEFNKYFSPQSYITVTDNLGNEYQCSLNLSSLGSRKSDIRFSEQGGGGMMQGIMSNKHIDVIAPWHNMVCFASCVLKVPIDRLTKISSFSIKGMKNIDILSKENFDLQPAEAIFDRILKGSYQPNNNDVNKSYINNNYYEVDEEEVIEDPLPYVPMH